MDKLVKIISKHKATSLGSLVMSAMIGMYSLWLLVIIASIALTYIVLAKKYSLPYIDSRFSLAVISVFTYIGLLCLMIIATSAIIEMSLGFVLLITFLIIFTFFIISRQETWTQQRLTNFTTTDGAAVVIAGISVLLIGFLPLINSGVLKQHSNIVITVTGNVDNGPHLGIFNDYIDFDTNQIWNDTHKTRSDIGGFYPTGWHGANAAITKAMTPSITAGTKTMIIYSMLFLFWIGFFIFLSVRLAFSVFQDINRNKRIPIACYIIMSLMMLFCVYMFSIHLLRFGFFSFVPQLITFIILLYPVRQLMRDGIDGRGMIGLMVIFAALSLATWLLLLPVVLLALLISIVIVAPRITKKRILEELRGSWLLIAIAIVAMLAQLWLLTTVESGGRVSFLEGIMLDGGVPIYDSLVYLALFVGLGGVFVLVKKRTEIILPALILTVSLLLFCGLLFVIQTYHSGGTHYYYYKSLLLLPAILVPLSVAASGMLISSLLSKNKGIGILLSVAIPVALLLFIPSDRGMVQYLSGSRSVSANTNSYIVNETTQTPYPSDDIAIFLVGTNESSDIASLLIQANRPHSACFDDLRMEQIIRKITQTAVSELHNYQLPNSCKNNSVKFVVGSEYENLLRGTSSQFEINILPSS